MLQYDAVNPSSAQRFCSCANVGRSVKSASLLISCPRYILNGAPDLAITNGLSEMPHGTVMFPPIIKLCLISNDERPNSPVRSYEYAGKLPAPSVSPLANPRR